MPQHTQIIHIEPLAAPKPALGAPCNGCGVCCLAEPCPLGMVLSRKRSGACHALQWHAAQRRYLCGAVITPRVVLHASLPWGTQWLTPVFAWGLGRLARRWIAAEMGCDSTLELERDTVNDAVPPRP
jgi:hypothetical protein